MYLVDAWGRCQLAGEIFFPGGNPVEGSQMLACPPSTTPNNPVTVLAVEDVIPARSYRVDILPTGYIELRFPTTTTTGQVFLDTVAWWISPQMPPPAPVGISAIPKTVDLTIYQGDDTYIDVTVTNADGTPADLSTAVPSATIATSNGVLMATFNCSINNNVITCHLSSTDSQNLPLVPTVLVWDCQIATPAVTTLVQGTVSVMPQVTP